MDRPPRISDSDTVQLFFGDFIASARKLLDQLDASLAQLRVTPEDVDALTGLQHAFHALKGNASFIKGVAITPLARASEAAVDCVRRGGGECSTQLLDVLGQAVARMRFLIDESGAAGKPIASGEEEERLTLALATMLPLPPESRYLFSGEDVTEELKTLARIADQPRAEKEAIGEARGALERLAMLARTADVHDVARHLEEIETPAAADAQEHTFDVVTVREALRLLAPLLEHTDR